MCDYSTDESQRLVSYHTEIHIVIIETKLQQFIGPKQKYEKRETDTTPLNAEREQQLGLKLVKQLHNSDMIARKMPAIIGNGSSRSRFLSASCLACGASKTCEHLRVRLA